MHLIDAFVFLILTPQTFLCKTKDDTSSELHVFQHYSEYSSPWPRTLVVKPPQTMVCYSKLFNEVGFWSQVTIVTSKRIVPLSSLTYLPSSQFNAGLHLMLFRQTRSKPHPNLAKTKSTTATEMSHLHARIQ